jgi:type I restriction enzyme S subunit
MIVSVEQPCDHDGISILRSTNFRADGEVSFDNLAIKEIAKKDKTRKLLLPGDILVEKSGGGPKQPVGRVVFFRGSPRPHVFGNFIARLRTKQHICDPKFLFWFLHVGHKRGVTENFQKQTTGIRNLEFKRFLGQQIPLPPLDEQRRIVGLLDRAAEIRHRADAARAKARAIIPALFLDTFGDPATNPKGWPVMTLGEAISSGPQNGLYKPATDYGSGVRILRIDSFDDGTIADQGALKRLRIDGETIDKFRLAEGDIVVNRVNSPPQLGKSVLIPRLEEPVVFESNMMRMRVNSELLHPSVLGVMLQLASVRQALIKNAKHAINQSSINQGDVTGILVFTPPIALQSAFADRIQRIELLAHHLDAAAAKAGAMAAGLSAEVFGASPQKGNGHG